MKQPELIDKIKRLDGNLEYLAIIWSERDVRQAANDAMGVDITDEASQEILKELKDDTGMKGINWDSICEQINKYIDEHPDAIEKVPSFF